MFALVLITERSGEESLLLTYAVPPGAAEGDLLGAYVLAPLGDALATGYVVALAAEAPVSEERIRPIAEVLGDSARLSPHLVALGRWMAYHTCSPLAECYRAMLPARAQETIAPAYEPVRRADTDQPALFADTEVSEDRDPVVAVLEAADSPLTGPELEAVLGRPISAGRLRELVRSGRVRVRHVVIPSRTGRKSLLALGRVGSPDEARAAAASLPRRASAQAAILTELAGRDEPVPLVDLGNRRSASRALVQRGLARVVRMPVLRSPSQARWPSDSSRVALTEPQRKAVAALCGAVDRRQGESFLLYGVTGSGKTEVYLAAIEHAVRRGGQSIVLVPEISLTPQVVARFRARFGQRVAVLHSALGTGERLDEWTRVRDGEADVVVGARSAIFAPVRDLCLVVVDEEHEHSYKQNSTPRYHARDVAVERGRLSGAPVVLGSATPSFESYQAALDGVHHLLVLPERVAGGDLPPVELVDMRKEPRGRRGGLVSSRLTDALREVLARREQAILLLNRRGWAPFLLCRECGEVIRCANCAVSLTYHQRDDALRCHHCGAESSVPSRCPTCRSEHIHAMGTGTERAEQEVREFLPDARVIRMDRDTTREKGAHGRLLGRFARGEADILMGTQMIAKGLDFPRVTLVGVLNADTSLHFPDFRAPEQTFSLLAQVSGRAGRGPSGGRVLIQTFTPDHWAIECATRHDYEGLFAREIVARRRDVYPPFVRLANLVAADEDAYVAESAADAVARAADPVAPAGGRVLGPAPAPLERLRGRYRFHVELFAPADELSGWVANVLRALSAEHRRVLTVDMDPLNLM